MPEELNQWIASLHTKSSSESMQTATAAVPAAATAPSGSVIASTGSSSNHLQEPRVVYVAFGNNVEIPHEVLSEMYLGLVAALDQGLCDGVIWSMSNNKRGSLPEEVDPRVELLSFAPQIALLDHPAVKLFVSHGGAESCHETMLAGKPMLVVPFLGRYKWTNAGGGRGHVRGGGLEATRPGLLTSVASPLTYAGWDCGRGSASASVTQLAWRSSSSSSGGVRQVRWRGGKAQGMLAGGGGADGMLWGLLKMWWEVGSRGKG